MNILIFGLDGVMRREKIEVIAGAVNRVSDTEAYLVEHGRQALEIRRPLFGFNPLGLFPPRKGLVLTAAANDGMPLLLTAGAGKHYRATPALTEKQEAERLRAVNVLSAQLAEHEAERGVKDGRWDKTISHGLYAMMGLFAILLGILLSPKIMETWSNYFGN